MVPNTLYVRRRLAAHLVIALGYTLLLHGSLAPAHAADKSTKAALQRMTPVPANEPVPVIDFFRPAVLLRPRLNPAGTHFAALISTPDDSWDLAAINLETKKIERISGGKGHDINRYYWLNDERLLFDVTREKRYATGLFAVELGRFHRSYVLQRYNAIIPLGFPEANPLHAILWIRHSAERQGGDGGVVQIDTSRSLQSETEGSVVYVNGDSGLRADIVRTFPMLKGGDPVGYMTNLADELEFGITMKDGVTTLHRLVDREWTACPVDLDQMHIVAVGSRPGELLVLAPPEEGHPRAVHPLDTVTGVLGEKLFSDDDYDLVDVSFYRHPVDHRILGMHYDRRGPHTVWFDPAYEEIHTVIQKSFPDRVVTIIGSDRAEKSFFIRASSDRAPPSYFHVRLETKSFSRIADAAPWIDPKRMHAMRLVSYKSRDGRDLEGYVTLPDGATPETPVPLVVLPHGGPWVRDSWGWDPEVQFLASRGYAVFQPNYRGSAGTAWRFTSDDMWAFRAMHDDVTDGVRTILRTRLIDRDRMAIMGWSFGAYLSLCGAAYEPDMYRCAITLSGVYDWEEVVKESRGNVYARGQYGRLKRKLGDPRQEAEKFEEISPLRAVSSIKIPIFVAHGRDDMIANVAQSKNLIAALKKNRVSYVSKIERDEGHGFKNLDNKVELYTALEAFLAEHLAVRTAPAAAADGAR